MKTLKEKNKKKKETSKKRNKIEEASYYKISDIQELEEVNNPDAYDEENSLYNPYDTVEDGDDDYYEPRKLSEMEKGLKKKKKKKDKDDYGDDNDEGNKYMPVTVADWLIAFLVQFVPVLGLLVTMYWAVSRRTQPSKRSWARAILLLYILIAGIIYFFYQALWGYFIDVFDL